MILLSPSDMVMEEHLGFKFLLLFWNENFRSFLCFTFAFIRNLLVVWDLDYVGCKFRFLLVANAVCFND